MRRCVVIFSGGQDSTTCLYLAKRDYDEVFALTFDYEQKHKIEIEQACRICEIEEINHAIIELPFLHHLSNSALVKNGNVNETNDLGLPSTFVPNRNQLFITLAHAFAQQVKANVVMTGVCETDYSGYPDCRREFIDLIQKTSNNGSGIEGTKKEIEIITPLMYLDKGDTFTLAKKLGVLDKVIEHSHTCYNGDREHKHEWGYGCGECPACELRKSGFEEFKRRTSYGNENMQSEKPKDK